MATWDSYTQKSTPEDNDTLMIKDTSGSANKRTPFSGVWNWIVSKLTSAVISQLETTNKSIIPAINELNSKCVGNCKVVGFGNKGTIQFSNINSGYGSALVFSTRGIVDLITVSTDNASVKSIIGSSTDTTASYASGTLTIKLGVNYGHGAIIAGGNIASSEVEVSVS